MKGLLLKDWYQIKSNMKTMYLTVLAVLVIWTLSASGASTFAMNYAAIFLGILPVSLLAYDHSSGWTEYGLTLPMSRKIQVAEKYLIGVICAAVSVGLSGVSCGVIVLMGKPLPDAPVSIWMEFGVLAILLMNGIMLPLYYRFGPEKARMLYMLMFAGMGAMLGGGIALMDELQQNGTGSVPLPVPLWLAAAFLLAVLALYAVSWRVSVAWYGKYKK